MTILLLKFLPELRDFLICMLILYFLLQSDYLKAVHVLNYIIHFYSSLYGDPDIQRQKWTDMLRMRTDSIRCNPMKAIKSFGKAFRCLISVFESQINDFRLTVNRLQCSQIQSAVTDIFHQTVARQNRKSLLQIEWRNMHGLRDILRMNILKQMLLHISDCLL